ncbi:MAG: hypothetical protein KF721_04815 [Ignavibacteriaceae bacterium]|nr:hypothetical protein [Ignavibacteriaceae bacterium]
MKVGTRKFIGFIITAVFYTAVLMLVIVKQPNMIVDLSVFASQSAFGYVIISGAFFASNVLEHYSQKVK